MTTERDLYGFLGGTADSGARYKIEIVRTETGYASRSASSSGTSAWKAIVPMTESDLPTVTAKAIAKFAAKTVPGRDRAYTRPMDGGPTYGPFPTGGSVLPDHPLCWAVGRSLDLLPAELRHRAVLAPGQASTPPPTPPPTLAASVAAGIGPAGRTPPWGQHVMLCETIPDAASLELMTCLDQWIMTEKMEGDRIQAHHDGDGLVYLTKRSGELAFCPPALAVAMQAMTPPGTSLDGELLTVDTLGRAQLYVGAIATIPLFVAFDVIAHPAMPAGMDTPQFQRLTLLASILPPFIPPLASDGPVIRCVPHAFSEEAKRTLLATIRARHGEGVVMRSAPSRYEGRRSHSWQRFCDRERTLDAVVMTYKLGIGKFAATVGGVEVGLFDGDTLRSIGWSGGGWTDAQRTELKTRWDAGRYGYVITMKSYGLSFADQVIRPSSIRIRPDGDKSPHECTFLSEVGRPYGSMRQP